MQASQLPTKFPIPFASSAGVSYIRDIPQASQIGITDGAASLYDGFPPMCFIPVASGGIPPDGLDFNGLLKQVTAWSQWQAAGGTVKYDSSFCTSIGGYPAGAVLASSATTGLFWYNSTDNNTTNPDGGSPSGWIPMGPAAPGIGHIATDTSSSVNVITVTTVSPAITTVASSTLLVITKSSTGVNTGAMTFSIAGTTGGTAVTGSITWADGSALASGDWPASVTAIAMYNGSTLIILSMIGPAAFARLSLFQPSSTITFYVNSSLGNDSNDGLANTSGHAFATLQGAVNAISTRYFALAQATINIANGTYAGATINNSGIVLWSFYGDPTTPSNVTVSSTSSSTNGGRGFQVNRGATVELRGLAFSSYYENAHADGGRITIRDCNLSAPSVGTLAASAYNGGNMFVYGTINYSGSFVGGVFGSTVNSSVLIGYQDAVTTNSVTLHATGTPHFGIGFAVADNVSIMRFTSSVITLSGSATGYRYSVSLNSVIDTNNSGASYLPGDASGTSATGGQYH